ncbi:LamB/YcsF family protein [Umezawaea beigongshangensis]|uniref:LamB/YcsF family protein n=1 Tax=Umezawaea beigongshangensis TaxID=2780383 RepID=UPI0027DDFCF7|nr:LamB/YcsF family protein [Umezawaea beigongshangensis]
MVGGEDRGPERASRSHPRRHVTPHTALGRHEAQADAVVGAVRAHDPRLVVLGLPGAVLHDPAEIARRCVVLATEGWISSTDGHPVRMRADSFCVHGDAPGAVDVARCGTRSSARASPSGRSPPRRWM